MPKTVFQRIVFTFFGVLHMATTMATYNKYLVYREFSPFLFRQVAVSVCQKAPLAFVLQFFFVQKFAGRQAARYPTDNPIVYQCIRAGFTVLIMCPVMCLYSNVINMFSFGWSVSRMLASCISRMPVNWIFAFCAQIWLLGPLNRWIFRRLFSEGSVQ